MKANDGGKTWELAKITAGELGLQTDLAVVFLSYLFEQARVFDQKQQDYGADNIAGFGEYGILVRASDKFARMKNLRKLGMDPRNESVRDTWLDLGNYAPMALMCLDGDWPGVESES